MKPFSCLFGGNTSRNKTMLNTFWPPFTYKQNDQWINFWNLTCLWTEGLPDWKILQMLSHFRYRTGFSHSSDLTWEWGGETGSYDSLFSLKYWRDSRSLVHIICWLLERNSPLYSWEGNDNRTKAAIVLSVKYRMFKQSGESTLGGFLVHKLILLQKRYIWVCACMCVCVCTRTHMHTHTYVSFLLVTGKKQGFGRSRK